MAQLHLSGIRDVIAASGTRNVRELTDEGKILFEFLKLILDIQYRHKYGQPEVANQKANDYSDDIQSKNVVADHITPVDDGLLRH